MVIGFTYHNIELYKSESLGSGSYGGVCKAKCDGLLCAAKIMHPTLFDPRDPGTASYLRKFQEECHLLSLARHPNVVQYLGTYTDPDTQLLVLLMELCDESLTSFLERSPGPLSYHVQVNICHNIALALVYLHSNGLIHRDLTGNNILMIAGTRAKITDFGMSKLATVNPRMTALTLCPGNILYMSPEALDEAKSYTPKLDVFSFGVIAIQILTRLFPNPTNRFRCIMEEVHGEVRVLVPEAERRWSHLSLIPDTHSMKPPTLQCLKKEKERPSALELSEILCDLKQSPKYSESVAVHQEDLHATNKDNKELQQTKRELDHYKQLVSEFQQSLKRKDETITDLQNTVSIQKRKIQQLNQQNRASGAQQEDQPVPMPQTTAQRDISKMRWREGKNAPEAMSRGAAVVHGNTVYFRSAETNKLYSYQSVLGDEEWCKLPDIPNRNCGLAVVDGLLTGVGGWNSGFSTNTLLSLRVSERKQWSEIFPPMPTPRADSACMTAQNALVVAAGIYCRE